jgi:hypothetical protein
MSGVWIRTDSKTITKFNIVPELEAQPSVPNGVWCLEFGHSLGLPDLYNTNSAKTILGPWELMDEGSFNGNPPGSSPAHMTAWGKIKLGFISGPILATAYPGMTYTFTVDPTEITSTKLHAIKIQFTSAANSDDSQYYLVEVRTKTGFDSALPAAGVLITYVDETLLIGPVHLINHPAVTSLNYAVWNVNETFTDNDHKLSVTITRKVGNSYQITITDNNQHRKSIGSSPETTQHVNSPKNLSTQRSTQCKVTFKVDESFKNLRFLDFSTSTLTIIRQVDHS